MNESIAHNGIVASKRVIALVAVARNGVIGRNQELPWRLRSDLQRFKKSSMSHCLIMGRKTYDSIGRPLPGRQTIIVSRQPKEDLLQTLGTSTGSLPPSDTSTSLAIASSLEEALDMVPTEKIAFIVGGAEIYRQAMPLCTEVWLTRVEADVDGDASFHWNTEGWNLVSSESIPAGEFDQYPTTFQRWTRKAISPSP